MDILMFGGFADVNLAYFVLALAIMMSAISLIVPGTFVPETISVFLILGSVFYAIKFEVRLWPLLILFAGIVLVIISMFSKRRFFLLSVGMIVLLIGSVFVYALPGELISVNLWFALFVSLICYGAVWLIGRKAIETKDMRDYESAKDIIGEKMTLPYDIDGKGSLAIGGEDWSVECDGKLFAGTAVEVISRDGLVAKIVPVKTNVEK